MSKKHASSPSGLPTPASLPRAEPIIVLGATGQVGAACVERLRSAGRRVVPVTRQDVDLSKPPADVRRDFSTFLDANLAEPETSPQASQPVVLNLAAWTAVDDAERIMKASKGNTGDWLNIIHINGLGPIEVAKECQERGIPMVQVSTDYVFGGGAQAMAAPCGTAIGIAPDATPEPANAYGRSKLIGEHGVLAAGGTVVRTAWVFSGPTGPGRDFVDTMATLANKKVEPKVVDDQYGRPTFAGHLADALIEVCDRVGVLPKILHATGSGEPTTWWEFAQAIFEATGNDPERVSPILTSGYPTPAPRPTGIYLDIRDWEGAGLNPLPAWRDGLREALG